MDLWHSEVAFRGVSRIRIFLGLCTRFFHPLRLAADADRVEVEFVDEVDDGRKRTAAANDC